MNAKHGQPAGTTGAITFDASDYAPARTVKAVRDEQGRFWINTQGALWLPATVRDDQFTAA